ncbi:hypothetical protein P879_04861 [Paragonimus westermani]|uniref:TLDc domain-containing protein n=1 Tax=Paragonimus westermani TaxID=34504 RepID=A0A8T0DR50_9TREM|nr:hypothetical protein P879_04861 [Paragonimus westermani]
MGNVESDKVVHKQKSDTGIYRGVRTEEPSGLMVHENDFLVKFERVKLQSLGKSIWMRCSKSGVFSLRDYESLVQELNHHSDHLKFFVKLATDSQAMEIEPIFSVLLSWFSFGKSFTDQMHRALFGNLISSLANVTSVDTIAARMSTLFTDVADDLAKIVSHILKATNPPLLLDFSVSSGFSTLLTEEMLWLLSVILSAPFKRPNRTRLVDCAPLEIEQLAHLCQLYDSKSHGFSFTRMKELAFEYGGPIIMFLQTENYLFCLSSDEGLKDSMKTYGTVDSKLFQIFPIFTKLVYPNLCGFIQYFFHISSTNFSQTAGRSAKLAGPGVEVGIIYSNFTAKTTRRGLLIGHQPIASPVLDVNEGFTELRFTGGPPLKLVAVEIWAAGLTDQLSKLRAQKAWELQQVNKEKNRRFKLDEDWRNSADRQILSMSGVNVYHSATTEAELSSETHSASKQQ